MGWRSQVLLGRLRDQATVLATVALVTFVATTLLGTFALLLDATGDDAVDAALGRLPDTATVLEATIRVNNKDTQQALDAAASTFAATLGDVPTERSAWLNGRTWALPRAEGAVVPPLAYPASTPLVPEQADLLSGTWPDTARDDAGRLPVNVPAVAADRYGWTVGTEVPVRTLGGQAEDVWLVVGTHEVTGPPSAWTRDPLGGAGHDGMYPMPGTMGRLVTDLWGPVVVAPEALLGAGVTERAHLFVHPDLTGAPRGALAAARGSMESTQVRLSDALAGVGVSGSVRTDLGTTIDAAWRELTVTRVGVVVVGLLLAVLATTVMLQAARLLGERRAAEGELVAARGASPAQLRSLAVLEAALLALLVAGTAPWVARALFASLADSGGLTAAGLGVPPDVPVAVWVACAAVAGVLAVALVVPSWHVSGSSHASAHAHLVRTGADLALVALGGVALWQLLDYGAPLTRGAEGARLDPVLVLGPALVTLAAAVLALRLVGPVGRGVDALARDGRSLVVPLAAWQVARRPAAATGTILVVVLAVSAATFSHAFLATWRTSQLEQVDLALGTDARVDGARGEPLTVSADARAALTDAPDGTGGVDGVTVRPVVLRNGAVGRTLGADRGTSAIDAQVVGVDTRVPDALRGRGPAPWDDLVERLLDPPGSVRAPGPATTGAALPGDPQWLVARVTTDAAHDALGKAYLRLAVEDEVGARTWLSIPDLPLGEQSAVVVEVPRSRGPLRVVAASAVVALDAVPFEAAAAPDPRGKLGRIGIAVHDARVVDRAAGAGTADAAEAAAAQGAPVDLGDAAWEGSATSGGVARAVFTGSATDPTATGLGSTDAIPSDLPADGLVLDGLFDLTSFDQSPGRLVAHTWPAQQKLRALVTASLADRADLRAGGGFMMRVGDAQVDVYVEAVVPYLPAAPRGPAVLVDRTALGRVVTEAAGLDPLLDTWWLTAPPARSADLAAEVARATGGTATVRSTERTTAVAGPLRVAVPAALSLVTAATGVLVLVGLGTSAAAAVRSRRLELARLQALGAARRSLVGGLLGEHALLVLLGAVTGVAIGYGLSRVVAPVLTVSGDGRRPVPAPVLDWQVDEALAITAGLALTGCVVVALLATVLVRRASGALLRLGDDR